MISLKKIDMKNFNEVLKLELKEEQKNFVASNMYSLAEAMADQVSKPYAIYMDDYMVGFIMYDYSPERKRAFVSRLMIDYKFQGKGYAREALIIVINKIKQIEECRDIQISYSPKNSRAREVYKSVGFDPNGEFCEGEEVAIMKLDSQDTLRKVSNIKFGNGKINIDTNNTTMDILMHNREAWNNEVENGNTWTKPVSKDLIEKAKNGFWDIVLTPTISVPHNWFSSDGDIKGKKILCLASGGGQQGPILAAAGADVTVFDNSPAQLAQDIKVAERENLNIKTFQGDMRDLSRFNDEEFDIIFHPVSNCFIDNVNPVWQGCYRILKKGGILLSGFCNPLMYIFDFDDYDKNGNISVKYKIPYSDIEQLPKEQLEQFIRQKEPLTWGHTLDDQIGGQIKAGFVLTGFFEDNSGGDFLDDIINIFIATKAEIILKFRNVN